jgi:hypothetical protein
MTDVGVAQDVSHSPTKEQVVALHKEIVAAVAAHFGTDEKQLTAKEIVEAALACLCRDNGAAAITVEDIASIDGHANWSLSALYLPPFFNGTVFFNFQTLPTEKREAMAVAVRKICSGSDGEPECDGYPAASCYTLENFEHFVARTVNGYATGRIRDAGFNNLLFINVDSFLRCVVPLLKIKQAD